MGARFKANPAINAELRRSPGVAKAVERRAKVAAEIARRLAPRGATGNLADSIDVVRRPSGEGDVFRILVRDFKGHWHEFGTSKMAAHPFLRPGVEASGLRFRERR